MMQLPNRHEKTGETQDQPAQLPAVAKIAVRAVTLVAGSVDTAESIAKRAGLTKRNGQIGKLRLARKVAFNPLGTARSVLGATAAEFRRDESAGT